jgi:hypothetical protein
MQARANPRRRVIFPYPEYSASRLGLAPAQHRVTKAIASVASASFGEALRPMTLGDAAAAHVRRIVWCLDCRQQSTPIPLR